MQSPPPPPLLIWIERGKAENHHHSINVLVGINMKNESMAKRGMDGVKQQKHIAFLQTVTDWQAKRRD